MTAKTKQVFILNYMGEYYDTFDTYQQALSVKEDYNSFFSDNCTIVKRRIKI